ncbi:hypothetical protein DSUL_40053 [Desulfovibrionales bacterium]
MSGETAGSLFYEALTENLGLPCVEQFCSDGQCERMIVGRSSRLY